EEAGGYEIQIANEAYLDNADLSFQSRADGYGDDQAIIDALKTEPDVMVVDSFALAANQAFGGEAGITLELPTSGTFEAPVVEVQSPDGSTHPMRVIGVIDSAISTMFGFYVGAPAGD